MQFIKNGDKTKQRMRRTTLQDVSNHLLNVHLRTLLVILSCKLQVVALDNFPPAYHENVNYAFKTIWRKYQHSTSLALHTQSQRTSNKVLPNICNQACNNDVLRKSLSHVYENVTKTVLHKFPPKCTSRQRKEDCAKSALT